MNPGWPGYIDHVEGDLAQVGDHVRLGHRLVGNRDRHGVANLLGGDPARHRPLAHPGEDLLPDVGGGVDEPAPALGAPIEIANGFGAFGHAQACSAASRNHSFAISRRNTSAPTASTM